MTDVWGSFSDPSSQKNMPEMVSQQHHGENSLCGHHELNSVSFEKKRKLFLLEIYSFGHWKQEDTHTNGRSSGVGCQMTRGQLSLTPHTS
jgi:hypothetical protein